MVIHICLHGMIVTDFPVKLARANLIHYFLLSLFPTQMMTSIHKAAYNICQERIYIYIKNEGAYRLNLIPGNYTNTEIG